MFGSNTGCSRGPDRSSGRGSGPARRSRTSAISAVGALVRGLDAPVLLDVGVGEDRDLVLEVVEGDDRVGEHQRHVGQAELVRVGLAEALDGAHAVVAEEADRPAGERGQAGQRGLAVLGRHLGGDRVRVAAVGQAPAHDAARLVADERPAADALALLGGLEQEGGTGAAQLQEGGDGRLAVLHEGLPDRDEVVLGGRRADRLEPGRELLSDGGQRAPPPRRRA